MPELIVFISHRSSDAAIAQRLVELLEKSLKLSARQIRCTSVAGYKLAVGADTDEQLRREVFEARAFIGLITPSSIHSPYVMFELGARWGAKKHLAPVLAHGADATSLGGPLSGLNALRLDQRTEVIQLVEDVADYLKMNVEPAASFQNSIDQLVIEASKRGEGSPEAPTASSGTVPLLVDNLSDEEMVGIIRDWLNRSGAAQSLKPIHFKVVDAELHLPPGSARRLIEQAASRWYVVAQRGDNLIVFEDKPRERSPSRRDLLKGF